MPEITINSAAWADCLDPKYRYIFIKGGRSSGKSWEVSSYLTQRSFFEDDLKIIGLREIQKSIDKSSKSLIDQTMRSFGIDGYYQSIQSEIRKKLLKDNGLFYFQGMNDLTADNIKSLEGFDIAWFEEAQNASHRTLKTLRPTIRKKGSQIIFTWNPRFPEDAIEEFCDAVRNEPDVLVVHVNYEDNPFLTDEIIREVELDRKNFPDEFNHIWLGDYDTSFHGHYYAKLLDEAQEDGRVSGVPRQPGVDVITAWDLGKADSTAIWVAQIVGKEPRIIDHIEDNFKDLDFYADWIKKNNYNVINYLPHDAKHNRLGMKGSIEDQLKKMGVNNTRVLPVVKVDAGRRLAKNLIKRAWFDDRKTRIGRLALKREKAEMNERTGKWREIHEQDSAAAFRYLAQSLEIKEVSKTSKADFSIGGGGSSAFGI